MCVYAGPICVARSVTVAWMHRVAAVAYLLRFVYLILRILFSTLFTHTHAHTHDWCEAIFYSLTAVFPAKGHGSPNAVGHWTDLIKQLLVESIKII